MYIPWSSSFTGSGDVQRWLEQSLGARWEPYPGWVHSPFSEASYRRPLFGELWCIPWPAGLPARSFQPIWQSSDEYCCFSGIGGGSPGGISCSKGCVRYEFAPEVVFFFFYLVCTIFCCVRILLESTVYKGFSGWIVSSANTQFCVLLLLNPPVYRQARITPKSHWISEEGWHPPFCAHWVVIVCKHCPVVGITVTTAVS